MKILRDLKSWWNRPPARDRVLAALSDAEWRLASSAYEAAQVSLPRFYVEANKLEQLMLIESRFDMHGPSSSRRLFYRRLPAGTTLLRVKK